eukprot:12420504-Karenia_brevis.AAC.1
MGQSARPPGLMGMMPMNTVLEAEDEDKESNRMQDDEAEGGEAKAAEDEGKPKWQKGKKAKWEKTQGWDGDDEKPGDYEAESQKRKKQDWEE